MSILLPIFVIPFLIGALIFLCFRTKKSTHRVVLICAALSCIFVGYASTNPIPGNEGPGLLAFMYVSLTAGAAVCLLICRFLPKPLPMPRSPVVLMSGFLLGQELSYILGEKFSVALCGGGRGGYHYSEH